MDGKRDIIPVKFESEDYVTHYTNGKGERVAYQQPHFNNPAIRKAILKCIGESDFFKISIEDGVINVEASHHDGTNVFHIRQLSDKGIETIINAEDSGSDYKPDDTWFKPIVLCELQADRTGFIYRQKLLSSQYKSIKYFII